MSKVLKIGVGTIWDQGRFHMRDTHQTQIKAYNGIINAGHHATLLHGWPGRSPIQKYNPTDKTWSPLEDVNEFDLIMSWGFNDGYQHLHENYLVGELGYFADRYDWVSLSWNGLNNYGDFCNDDVPSDRWQEHFVSQMSDWKEPGQGKYILLAGQVPGDQNLQGLDMEPIYQKWVYEIQDKYGLPVRWRKHPLSNSRFVPKDAEVSDTKDIMEDILGSEAVCMFNSNTSVDAIMNGIPAICHDSGTMAWDVCTQGFTDLQRPDRTAWGVKMGYTQWHNTELESGKPFEHILKKFTETHNG